MEIRLQPNPYQVRSVLVRRNSEMYDLLTLSISEGPSAMHLTLDAAVWQRVADALAAAGVTPAAVAS